jgi:hypothetical protein
MNESDTAVANRIILAAVVIFIGALVWVIAIDSLTELFGITFTGKLWLGLVLGTAVVTDKIYRTITKHKFGSKNASNT